MENKLNWFMGCPTFYLKTTCVLNGGEIDYKIFENERQDNFVVFYVLDHEIDKSISSLGCFETILEAKNSCEKHLAQMTTVFGEHG